MEKIIEEKEIQKLIERIGSEKIVLVGGCFDIVHLGHSRFLEEAKKKGNKLIVLLESDENIKKLKGKKRPINNQDKRAEVLSKLKSVDYVVKLSGIKSDEDYDQLVEKIRPKVIAVSEGDINIAKKRKQVDQVGGELIVVTKLIPHQSTSQIIKTALI